MTAARARAVADAVLYEGYLLYPYRANARKNQSRWQFGVLGPPGAAEAGFGEADRLTAQCLAACGPDATVTLTLRFLQLQRRDVYDADGRRVPELRVGERSWISWDEAVEREPVFGPVGLSDTVFRTGFDAATEAEELPGAVRLVRIRGAVEAVLELSVVRDGDFTRLNIVVRNAGASATDRRDAIVRSLIGAHVIVEISGGEFVSLLDPPERAVPAVARCGQQRCFPVLAGPPGDHSLVLISPIILYDHPQIAPESELPLFDSTEIDEILMLRVMTLTDEEKRQARATDPRAAEIIDRCEAMSPQDWGQLHGTLRDPSGGVPWWDPAVDAAVRPESDAVLVAGTPVRKGSRVRLRPSRRADAHDLFYDGRLAHVVAVHSDVDDRVHVAVVVDDDPAADLHEWYGRYLYFAPDELEPIEQVPEPDSTRKE
ncbi:hypothetical protein [Nocardia pseudobrasiliensis]|uniref:Uncharacterized protein n=1 Tax=Nocardia pseudobrasiliensis TaxID=45979 RepID=A0A370HSV3_9NOCA|nr:hypothetical protein [Nocardia pseudobrasiliensis]RDI61599.1 hypothetical protein DFR76_113100 [Nocardia pseudobrasiliensis]